MSPRTEKQYEAIREKKRGEILNAALELFGHEGYHNTTISKVAKEAGISKGLVYNYFSSKEELIRQIVDQGIEEMMEIVDPNKDGVLNQAEIQYFIEKMFEHLQNNTKFWKLYFSVLLQPAIYPLVKEKFDAIAQPVMTLAVNYFSSQGFDDPQMETFLFGALLDGIGFHFIMDPEHYPLEAIKDQLLERYANHSKKDST